MSWKIKLISEWHILCIPKVMSSFWTIEMYSHPHHNDNKYSENAEFHICLDLNIITICNEVKRYGNYVMASILSGEVLKHKVKSYVGTSKNMRSTS